MTGTTVEEIAGTNSETLEAPVRDLAMVAETLARAGQIVFGYEYLTHRLAELPVPSTDPQRAAALLRQQHLAVTEFERRWRLPSRAA